MPHLIHPRLIGLAIASLLIGCSSSDMKAEMKADLMDGFIASGTVQSATVQSGTVQSGTVDAARQTRQTLLTSASPAVAAGRSGEASVAFRFHAFGDSGWSQTHTARPLYQQNQGFRQAYSRFDSAGSLLGDLNYINWETSVGKSCEAFWSKPSSSTYAFLTHPEELVDAIRLGFNLVGLANNHSFDCLRSAEGLGPLQTAAHIARISRQFQAEPRGPRPLFSGVFASPDQEPAMGLMPLRNGASLPVTFLSAYVGGDPEHCRQIVCDAGLDAHAERFARQSGLRVLALHSWDKDSHARLKTILQSWLQRGLVDVALGSGPHIAEDVRVIHTPKGPGVLATSLGNFIHPSLSRQPYNIALLTDWTLQPSSGQVRLQQLRRTILSCDAETCRQGRTVRLWSAPGR